MTPREKYGRVLSDSYHDRLYEQVPPNGVLSYTCALFPPDPLVLAAGSTIVNNRMGDVARFDYDASNPLLRERDFPVEYIVADDEGHGFRQPVNNMAMFARAEGFLAKYLGGRYQKEMPDDMVARLGELTVDVASVKLPEEIDMASVGVPMPVNGLVERSSEYEAKIDLGGSDPADVGRAGDPRRAGAVGREGVRVGCAPFGFRIDNQFTCESAPRRLPRS